MSYKDIQRYSSQRGENHQANNTDIFHLFVDLCTYFFFCGLKIRHTFWNNHRDFLSRCPLHVYWARHYIPTRLSHCKPVLFKSPVIINPITFITSNQKYPVMTPVANSSHCAQLNVYIPHTKQSNSLCIIASSQRPNRMMMMMIIIIIIIRASDLSQCFEGKV